MTKKRLVRIESKLQPLRGLFNPHIRLSKIARSPLNIRLSLRGFRGVFGNFRQSSVPRTACFYHTSSSVENDLYEMVCSTCCCCCLDKWSPRAPNQSVGIHGRLVLLIDILNNVYPWLVLRVRGSRSYIVGNLYINYTSHQARSSIGDNINNSNSWKPSDMTQYLSQFNYESWNSEM